MRKLVFFLVAVSLFNQSIDFDHLTMPGTEQSESNPEYDDLDSIFEWVVESLLDDQHYTSEADSDSSDPMNKSFSTNPQVILYYESQKRISVPHSNSSNTRKCCLHFCLGRPCKGYYPITVPPPDTHRPSPIV